MEATEPTPGRDTATGTDPDAKFDEPGYEDKSFGQAVKEDQSTVDRLMAETGGDPDEAARLFESESAGAPARARQAARERDHEAGATEAARGRSEEPPA